jgi:hypothetical protein
VATIGSVVGGLRSHPSTAFAIRCGLMLEAAITGRPPPRSTKVDILLDSATASPHGDVAG